MPRHQSSNSRPAGTCWGFVSALTGGFTPRPPSSLRSISPSLLMQPSASGPGPSVGGTRGMAGGETCNVGRPDVSLRGMSLASCADRLPICSGLFCKMDKPIRELPSFQPRNRTRPLPRRSVPPAEPLHSCFDRPRPASPRESRGWETLSRELSSQLIHRE